MAQRDVTRLSATGWRTAPAVSTRTGAPASGPGFRHEALLYSDGDTGLVQATLALIVDAVEDEAGVLVAVSPARENALREALDDYAQWVSFADMHECGRNPARIIALWDDFLQEQGDSHPLGIDEPAWPGRSAAELSECERHESLLNLAFGDGAGWHLLCPYDLDGLEDQVIDAAQHTHPLLARNGRSRPSGGYSRLRELPDPFAGDLPAPRAPYRELAFTAEQLAELRHEICEWSVQQSLGAEQSEELVLAVNELTTNSIRHGGGAGVLRLWREERTLLCEVQDRGRMEPPLVGRRRPDAQAYSGRGIWIANQLCDLVQIRSAPAGTRVRVHKALA